MTRYRAPQNGRMTLHILPYRVPYDASRCAALRLILFVTSVLMKPWSAVRKFFRDISTLLSGRLIVYPIISSRTPNSVLSSATDSGPSRSVHISFANCRSDATSSAKHTPIISSTYMTVLLFKACRSSHVIARVTTWNAAGVPDHPNIPTICKYTRSSLRSMANSPTSSGRKDSKVYAPRKSIFHMRMSSQRTVGSRCFAVLQKSYIMTAMSSMVGWRISP